MAISMRSAGGDHLSRSPYPDQSGTLAGTLIDAGAKAPVVRHDPWVRPD